MKDRFIVATMGSVLCRKSNYSEALEKAKEFCKTLNCKVYVTKTVDEIEVDDEN